MEPVFRMLVCTFPPSHPQTRIKFAAVVRDSFRRDKEKKRESNTSDVSFFLRCFFPVISLSIRITCFLTKIRLQQIKLRTRTESDIPAHDGFHLWMTKRAKKRQMEQENEDLHAARRRAPTLGAFGGFDMNLFK